MNKEYIGETFLFTPAKQYILKGFTVKSINGEFVKFDYLTGNEQGSMMAEFFLDHLKNKIFIQEDTGFIKKEKK
jgi:hypothetical protein